MPRGFYTRQGSEEDRKAARAKALDAFDRAAESDARNELANERLDLRRSHEDFTQAFKQAHEDAMAQQRAADLALRERGVSVREQAAALDQKAFDLQQAQRAAQVAELNRKMEAATKINNDTAGYFNSIAGLDPHTPEYRSRLDAITKQFPNALQAEGPQKHYSATMSVHDKWVAEHSKPIVPPALKLEADRLDKEYFNEVAAWQKFKANLQKQGLPDQAAPNEGAIADLRAKRDQVGAQIHALTNPVPIDTAQAPAPSEAVPVTGAAPTAPSSPPSVIDPRVALAQKALDDPNASEAHKAAARKILGYQGE